MIKYYHILQHDRVLSSNLPPIFIKNGFLKPGKVKTDSCPITKSVIRHGSSSDGTIVIYLVSYDNNITNKIFNRYLESFNYALSFLSNQLNLIKNNEKQNLRRLKHNLVTYNTNILQEFYKVFPQEALIKGGKNQLLYISDVVSDNNKDIANLLLRVLKNSNLIKAEFDVYDMISSNNPYLEFHAHPLHRIILLMLNPFWLDLIEKEVLIDIRNSTAEVYIDYKSISVAFCHLFENATKYIAPKSLLTIDFAVTQDVVTIYLEMTSLEVKMHEIDKIFEEGYSGELAVKLHRAGNGIGMSVVKKLLRLNGGSICFKKNIKPELAFESMGAPFERNQFIITLQNKKQ